MWYLAAILITNAGQPLVIHFFEPLHYLTRFSMQSASHKLAMSIQSKHDNVSSVSIDH